MALGIGAPFPAAAVVAAATALLLAAVMPVHAGTILDRARAQNTVRCGAEQRPGFAAPTRDGVEGLGLDLCRAAAIAVLGPGGRIDFRLLDSAAALDAVGGGKLDLVFLTGGLVAEGHLAAKVVPGPPVYIDQFALMVPEDSAFRRPQDLEGKIVCFMIGSPAQRALEAAFEGFGSEFSRLGFEEDVEMRDAYNVGRCQAIAGEATTLAVIRQDGGVNRLRSRILDQPLGLDPVLAATGSQDGAWSATVYWLLQGLVAASAAPSGWHGSGTGLDTDSASALGLREHWQADIASALGSYAEMLRRHTGEGSTLRLAPGPNAPWPAGVMLPPTVP